MSGMRRRGHEVEVAQVRGLSPRLQGVTLRGPELVGASFRAGDKVKINVGGGRFRSYTPATFDPGRGELEVIAFVHGRGAGSAWAAGAKPGQHTTIFGPVPSLAGPRGDEEWAWFLGDETTVGLFRALADALPASAMVAGAVELDEHDAQALPALALPLDFAPRQSVHGEALLAWLDTASVPSGRGTVWLSGHSGAIDACRKKLERRGIPPERIRAKAYWNRRKDRLRNLAGLA
ncbi:MAG: siderophore-interacting protein [Myxococcota bacterium]